MQPATDGFTDKRVTVMGLGRFGGGVAVTRWLCGQGASVLVTDLQTQDALAKSLSEITDLVKSGRVKLRLGEHAEDDFRAQCCDLVIANPAVPLPWTNRCLLAARDNGVPITTEIRLTVERLNRKRVIGVTGTAGKSTTAAMIHHVLSRMKTPAHLGGNIGGSLLNSLDSIKSDDWIVLELSSAMLYWLGNTPFDPNFRGWSPHIAVITNLSPNHLDWHGSFEHYGDCKYNIFRHQEVGDFAIGGANIPPSLSGRWSGGGSDLRASSPSHPPPSPLPQGRGSIRAPLRIPGAHNQLNAQYALEAVERATRIRAAAAMPLLADFPGLPHRLQLVAEFDGLRFFNDSKSTTPEAMLRAISAFDDPLRIHLVAGGYDKKIDLSPIAQASGNIAHLYTIGSTGASLASASTRAQYCETLDRAVETAINNMKGGDILLLSPGCASWDQFTNYEERGEAFMRLVHSFSRDAQRSDPRSPSGRGEMRHKI